MQLFRKNTPRWIVFTTDVIICTFSVVLAFLLRFNFNIPSEHFVTLYNAVTLILIIRIISFIIGKSYAGLVRFTSTEDAIRIFNILLAGSLVVAISNIINYNFISDRFIVPFSIVIIDFITTTFFMTAFRLLGKVIYIELSSPKEKSNVIIYGADQVAITTKKTFDRDVGTRYNVVAFVDHTRRNAGKKIEGVRIYHTDNLEKIIKKSRVNNLIFAKSQMGSVRKQEIIETCLNHDVQLSSVPDVSGWINGELSFNQIKNIKIEDLLERPAIKLDITKIKEKTTNKTIVVTGAAGSIGSEIVRQLSKYNPKLLILFDQAESPMYDLELELLDNNIKDIKVIIGDIRDKNKVENIISMYLPDVVYHAAAYKHVPLMEHHPYEAISTNVQGTRTLADACCKFEVKSFVMVSTDKAVNPTNVMGASKRIAEIYTQALNNRCKTNFITTRFGNVLGSNGSVIPRFREQIEKGGPVTVTHPEITRFFMTIPEACELVLEASAHSLGGKVYIFDMGKSVKIVDLAKKMIKLSGLELGKDIDLRFTGLRPGEKLYEELLNVAENTEPTHHDKIMKAKVVEYPFEEVVAKIDRLIKVLSKNNDKEIVRIMKEIVPEFKSQNSVFEELDVNSQD